MPNRTPSPSTADDAAAAVVLDVSLSAQCLTVYRFGRVSARYAVSTARNGAGERNGSGCTPRGRHVVRARIGAGLPSGAVLVGRRPTGEVWTPALAARYPQRDWILSRILWLSGLEPGRNRLGEVDTMRRYIYIHGTPETEPLGVPASHGCIRMSNADVIELFEIVPVGTEVRIG
ncbi:MAG: L,D-transpeptidase [Gammaproteobacteria bacterium]|nr:L,D-transpeptidase [Gammaproteobacteria bacterium]